MKTAARIALIIASVVPMLASAQLLPAARGAASRPAPRPNSMPTSTSGPDFVRSPVWIAQDNFINGRYTELEAIVHVYVESDTRTDDGAEAVHLAGLGLKKWMELANDKDDPEMAARLTNWHDRIPESALQPIVAAMHANATAWRARGRGYSSTVTLEGWRLFRERSQLAWNILMDNKERCSTNPLWYEEAIIVGGSLDKTESQLRALFEEGIRKHPGSEAIYSAYVRHFAPIWGGNWKAADDFIRRQSTAKGEDGDTLYATLYSFLDQSNNRSPTFFEESLADWARMRRGFEARTRAFPHGARSRAQFAAFACRAKDAATYLRLRPGIDGGEFKDIAPESLPVEVCDARFKHETPESSPRSATPTRQWVAPAGGDLPPMLLGQNLFENGQFGELESLVNSYIKTDARAEDGTQQLWYLSYGLDSWLQSDERDMQAVADSLAAWNAKAPGSVLQPIVAAMGARAFAWRARGNDYASKVTPEGWELFKDQSRRAWKILMDSKARSSVNPVWYHEALYVGGDLGLPRSEMKKLFEEGLRRHPDYYALYSAYMRMYAPVWGGDWDSADKAIVELSATQGKNGDALYARLYWYVDDFNARQPGFFEESRADWPRMRRGFDQLMAAHPKGARNHAAFASFACRANDRETYRRLRPQIDRGFFSEVAPRGVSVDMCDARFPKPE